MVEKTQKTEEQIADEELIRYQKNQLLRSYMSENSNEPEKVKRMYCKFKTKKVGDLVEAGLPFIFEEDGLIYESHTDRTIEAHYKPNMPGIESIYYRHSHTNSSGEKEWVWGMKLETNEIVFDKNGERWKYVNASGQVFYDPQDGIPAVWERLTFSS